MSKCIQLCVHLKIVFPRTSTNKCIVNSLPIIYVIIIDVINYHGITCKKIYLFTISLIRSVKGILLNLYVDIQDTIRDKIA